MDWSEWKLERTNQEIEQNVRRIVRDAGKAGNGIITDEAFLVDPNVDHIKVFLPTTLDIYAAHYRRRVTEGRSNNKLTNG